MLSQPSEMHRDATLSTRLHTAACQDVKHKETQGRALLCWAGLPLAPNTSPASGPRPVTAAGDGVPRGCIAPSSGYSIK